MFLIYQKNNVLKVTYVLSVTDGRIDGRTLYAPSGGTLLSCTVTNMPPGGTLEGNRNTSGWMVAHADRASRSPLLLHESYILKSIPQCS